MGAPGPVTLITGATEGIGRALAHEFAGAGNHLFLIARNKNALINLADRLRTSHDVTIHICALDLTKPPEREKLFREIEDKNLTVDILVNNAAIGLCEPFANHARDELLQLVDLNITALTDLCHQFLPPMLKRNRGGILNIASLGGMTPGPYQAAYYASKAYVISLTEALAQELAGTSLRISVLAPGPVNTEFHRKMGAAHAFYLKAFGLMAPEKVARDAIRGFNWRRTLIIPGLFNTISMLGLRLIPHTIMTPILAWLLKPCLPPD